MGTHSTAAIEPLVSTQWNQYPPFRNNTPCLDDGEHCASGSVATAVATLLQYCGYSVETNYGPSSSAYFVDVKAALTTYFDYNETAQYVSRNYYSYANWTDMLYHELANRRPVIYNGAAATGGHAFICDGYKYEQDIDFFHINWGWRSIGNGYYVLSTLNPYEPDTEGSISEDSYHIEQYALIGIQKPTDNGTVADIPKNELNLTANSMTLSSNYVSVNTPVTVTVNMKNNSSDDFDGELLIYFDWEKGSCPVGDCFFIPAGETKDCVFNFTPKEAGNYELAIYIPIDGGKLDYGGVWANLTVDDGPLKPTDVTATHITSHEATISWKGYDDCESYDVRYGVANWLQYDDGIYQSRFGTKSPETLTWGVMYPANMFAGHYLDKISIYETNRNTEDITVNIYTGGETAPGTLVHTQVVTPKVDFGFHEIELSSPVELVPGENLWITLTEKGIYIMPLCKTSEPNNQWIFYKDNWKNASEINSNIADYGWMIRGGEKIEDATTSTTTEQTILLTDLKPGKNYRVQVRANYPDGGQSLWSDNADFTTTDTATGIEQEPIAETDGNRQDVIFDLQGRRLKGKPARGLYISSGRVVIQR